MTMVNLVPGSEQQQLIDSVAAFLSEKLPVERLRPNGKSMRQESDLWSEIAELGWFGLSVAEGDGGAGFTLGDEVLLYREYGRYLLSPAVLATRLALHAAVHCHDQEITECLLSGVWRAAVALPKRGANVSAAKMGGHFQLIDPDKAELILAWTNGGFAVLSRDQFEFGDCSQSLDGSSTILNGFLNCVSPRIWLTLEQLALPYYATVLLSAMLVGNAEATRDMAVSYAKIREQFGKPIGAFQAIKHRCADMTVRVETAWAQTIFTGLALTEGTPMVAFDAHAAKILAADAAIKNSESNIQIHGGIGFTDEADPHLFVKRAQLLNQVGGNFRYHQRHLIGLDFIDS
jgi:alkylation response protein AidB-like acyl-CoA dehydrogenase